MTRTASNRRRFAYMCTLVVLASTARVARAQTAPTSETGLGPGRSRRPGTLVVSASSDSGLRTPGLLASDGRYAYVYDYANRRLAVFDRRGTQRWTVGGSVDGTLAFANPTDLQIAPDGTVWLLDAPRRRVTVLDVAGRVIRTIPLSKSVERLAPQSDGTFLGIDLPQTDATGYRFSSDGRIVDTIALPAYLRAVPWMAREGFVARVGRTDAVVKAYSYADNFTIWDSRAGNERTYHAPERIPFAKILSLPMPNGGVGMRIAPDAVRAAVAVTTDDTTIYVLYAGQGAYRGRTIDSYNAATGRYLGSYTLPFRADALTKVSDGFVAVQGGDAPAVHWLRLKR